MSQQEPGNSASHPRYRLNQLPLSADSEKELELSGDNQKHGEAGNQSDWTSYRLLYLFIRLMGVGA
jgi:hypothetical protein